MPPARYSYMEMPHSTSLFDELLNFYEYSRSDLIIEINARKDKKLHTSAISVTKVAQRMSALFCLSNGKHVDGCMGMRWTDRKVLPLLSSSSDYSGEWRGEGRGGYVTIVLASNTLLRIQAVFNGRLRSRRRSDSRTLRYSDRLLRRSAT